MTASTDKFLEERNCGANLFARAIDRGEDACECVDTPSNVNVVGRIHVKAVMLGTETLWTIARGAGARRAGQATCHNTAKPFPNGRPGK